MDFRNVPSGAKSAESVHFSHLSGITRVSKSSWTPSTDVFFSEDSLIIQVEVAGMSREDISLEAQNKNRRLWIRGRRTLKAGKLRPRYILMEINKGSFEFYIDLPDGYHLPSATPVYHNGILRIEIPLVRGPES